MAKLSFLTHPDKILYKEDKITKLDLIEYYQSIQKWMLPFIINRPLTLVRCPDGYQTCFYQKHLKGKPLSVASIKIKEKEGAGDYPYIKSIMGLLSLVQLGVLEFHAWGCNIKDIEHPNLITFDLDPAPEVSWKRVADAAKLLRAYLAKLNLKSFVLSSGGKGLHVLVPIKPEHTWEAIKIFSHAFVELIVSENPNEFVATITKSKRKGKIFIDYLRNQRGATAIVPYSTRAKRGATVATPLAWEELNNNIEKNQYTIFTLPSRLLKIKENPWKDFSKIKQKLNIHTFNELKE